MKFINRFRMEKIKQQMQSTINLEDMYKRYKKYLKGAK